MAKLSKTILQIEVDDKEFHLSYTGIVEPKEEHDLKTCLKHDQRIMAVLLSDDRAFRLFARLYEPVKRYRQREEKKQRKAIAAAIPSSPARSESCENNISPAMAK